MVGAAGLRMKHTDPGAAVFFRNALHPAPQETGSLPGPAGDIWSQARLQNVLEGPADKQRVTRLFAAVQGAAACAKEDPCERRDCAPVPDNVACAMFAARMSGIFNSSSNSNSGFGSAASAPGAVDASMAHRHFDLSKIKKLPTVVVHRYRQQTGYALQEKEIGARLGMSDTSLPGQTGETGAYQKVLIVESPHDDRMPDGPMQQFLTGLLAQGVLVLKTLSLSAQQHMDSENTGPFIHGGSLDAARLSLFTKFYLAAARSEECQVSYEALRCAVRLVQPARPPRN